uniref:LD29830p (inferred by orthology to a D. melanogaster protein) n=1 Tax=Strongyloides venezuelensis TaxID=75913 RepID=A0A0K0FN44_STRVS
MVSDVENLKVLHVTNVSGYATADQIRSLFKIAGRIDDFAVYPRVSTSEDNPKMAFIKYEKRKSLETAQHLTNTVFLDKALCCVPFPFPDIPKEDDAINNSGPVVIGKRCLPSHVTNSIKQLDDGTEMLYTTDPDMEALGLPSYPPLPGNTELDVVEEIRRTIYISNIPLDVDGQEVVEFFNDAFGEVMYFRMCQINGTDKCNYGYLEFSNQISVPIALQNSGIEFKGNALRITHSRVRIVKPQKKTNEQVLEEIKEASKNQNDKDETTAISVLVKRPRSRSIERERKESKRSPIKEKRRRSRSREKRRRTRSPSKEYKDRKRRERSKSRERRRRSRSRDKKSRKRSRSRDRHR